MCRKYDRSRISVFRSSQRERERENVKFLTYTFCTLTQQIHLIRPPPTSEDLAGSPSARHTILSRLCNQTLKLSRRLVRKKYYVGNCVCVCVCVGVLMEEWDNRCDYVLSSFWVRKRIATVSAMCVCVLLVTHDENSVSLQRF